MKIFDLHCDTFTEMFDQNLRFDDPRLAVNAAAFERLEPSVQVFAVWQSGNEPAPAERYRDLLACGMQITKYGFEICRTADEIDSSLSAGRCAALLSLEGGAAIDSCEFVERLYADGIRTVSLTWNGDNRLAGGALGDGGLTPLGRDVIRRMNEYGMVLDLSHLNRRSFFEAAELADRVAATHTGLNALVNHPRNLTDDQVSVMKQKNGLVGLCFYPVFIGENVYEGFLKAVRHACRLGLAEHIAVGSDFDGAKMPDCLSGTAKLAGIFQYVKNELGQTAAEKIFFENAMGFYRRALTNGGKSCKII